MAMREISRLPTADCRLPTTEYVGPAAHLRATVLATARGSVKRFNAYLIDVIRWPLFPLIAFATWRLTYAVSGHANVGGVDPSSFLLVGMIGLITWSATLWSGGYAIEHERYEGTIGALFMSPASRAAVVLGYGLGGFVWALPAFVVVTILGFATGARLHVADPLALAGALLALVVAALGTGFAFASLFVLSRRANLLANFLQLPADLLAGFLIPRASLPGWLYPLSNAIPVSHALDALRASALARATLGDIGGALAWALGLAALYALVGAVSLRRVEYAAKRTGQLELY
jgi:ABC-2 type transport system permease protein